MRGVGRGVGLEITSGNVGGGDGEETKIGRASCRERV